ncbi:helix-turn-helix transcriptional regulator [Sporosarcina sp. E16_8]|uniref:helix-turn-helix domain-containing protein n=1 Tax=Sporosarcina sp. E16_8 TaxID=2789295 RepID=UPI001A93247D|nr:helix-turn-helix transcriptional regulator [Sporosarcina sp. E16_8]MBO0586154.1 helix-turn-helix transcriptional regulator [Sporosarcina sp. E16_8]
MKEEDIGSKIRRLRIENGDTLKEMAKKVGKDFSSLGKIERGERDASIDLLRIIIDMYGADPRYFLGQGFTQSEGHLLIEEDLSPSSLKEKYDFVVDGVEATDDEIKEALRLIRYLRKDENSD